MRKSLFTALFTVCITLLASPAYALEGILLDRQGHYVTDGFGECVSIDKLKHFHKDNGAGYCADEAKKMAEPAPAPAPQVTKRNISLGAHALFNHDRSNLRPEGKRELDAVAAKLKSFSSVRGINVVGHTDSQGTDAYNQGLSERRAASVRQYLISKGVNGNLITASGKGETSPVASNATKEGRQQNRRVDISIRAVK